MPPVTPIQTIEAIYRQEWARLVRLAWLLTGSREEAEDIVHDTFVKLDAGPHLPDDPGPYLRRMVVNRVTDHHRRRSVERRHRPDPPEPFLNPEMDDVWGHLNALPVRQRRALVLRFHADLTIEQVADELSCPVGTATSLIHRGLNQLRREMRDDRER
jgi:RNA polymerase sigma factor (sigma-70 family)